MEKNDEWHPTLKELEEFIEQHHEEFARSLAKILLEDPEFQKMLEELDKKK